ncbi:neuronal acetylcholine receptor subunit beta-3-like [Gigantopelta aegis]|uniref:neuronal acetylcholine receptor subunit beta-3-like n=1 Tax=Gigantopelta aegis TaxID=1735272 RepID=UPI001B8899A1|nr:neuronal acetylcholine receptor subunit beta-3-like [Gigantopelta aegis]
MNIPLQIVCLLVLNISSNKCQQRSHMQELYRDMEMKSNPRIRPVQQQTTTTNVYLKYFLSSINGYTESSQTLRISGYLELHWKDEFLTWNASLYGGANHIKPDLKTIWKPAIAIKNAVDYKEMYSSEYNLNLFSNGSVLWYPGEDFETYCSMDVTMYPFDTQTCSIEFFITYDTIYHVSLYPRSDSVSLDAFMKSSEWEVVNTTVIREIRLYSNFEFSFVVVSMTMDRKPSNLILRVLFPVFILAFLNVLVFFVPVESGQKIYFAINCFLTYTVLLGSVTQTLPKSSGTTSILAAFVGAMFVINAIYVFLAVMSLRLFHRDASIHPVSMWCRRFVLFFQWREKIKMNLDANSENCQPIGVTPSLREVTWENVSRTLDNICLCVFVFGLLTTVFVLIAFVYVK